MISVTLTYVSMTIKMWVRLTVINPLRLKIYLVNCVMVDGPPLKLILLANSGRSNKPYYATLSGTARCFIAAAYWTAKVRIPARAEILFEIKWIPEPVINLELD